MKKHLFSFAWLGIEPRSAEASGRGIGSARLDRKTVIWLLGLTGLTAAVFLLPPSGHNAAADALPTISAASGSPASTASTAFSFSESAGHSDPAADPERGASMNSKSPADSVPGRGARTSSPAAPDAADQDPNADESFPVYVCGAVRHPQVLRVSAGMVLDDLVQQCGGLTETADAAAVNLAMAVKPNSRIYIPNVGESPQDAAGPNSDTAAAADSRSDGPGGGINLNTADLQQLCSLPGIGARTAERILADRARNGPFTDVEDLARVPGIKSGKLEVLRPLVFVD